MKKQEITVLCEYAAEGKPLALLLEECFEQYLLRSLALPDDFGLQYGR